MKKKCEKCKRDLPLDTSSSVYACTAGTGCADYSIPNLLLSSTSADLRSELATVTEQRDRLVVALRECLEDSMELKAEHDWRSSEPRCGRQVKYQRQKRYQETLDNITRANETLQSLHSPINTQH